MRTRRLAPALMMGVLFAGSSVWVRGASGVKLRPTAPIYADGKGAPLKRPEGVACRGNDLVVADTGNGRLVRYSVAPDSITPRGEISIPQLPYPIRAQLTAKGELLVLDGKLRKIARLAVTGEFLSYLEFGGGDSPLGTVVPKSFRIGKDDTLYILDVFGGRVLVLAPDGKLLRQIALPKPRGFISDLAVDAAGNVYLTDSVQKRVFLAGKDAAAASPLGETMMEDVDFPTAIASDGKGHLYVLDHDGGGIVILGQDGSFQGRQSAMGWKEGFLRYPSDLCSDERGSLFVADRENDRVQVFVTAP